VFRPLLSVALTVGAIGSMTLLARAQSPTVVVDHAQEKVALAFAREHHPELAELLQRLRKSDRDAFEKAVRDVFQASERLARLQENDPERYELALQSWTLDSRIRLLAARSTMSNDPGIEGQLRELLHERQNVRIAMLQLERERLQTRLERINGQIEQWESNPTAVVENDLARIKREMRASANRERRAAASRPPKELPQKTRELPKGRDNEPAKRPETEGPRMKDSKKSD
jgi:hypothetical protein